MSEDELMHYGVARRSGRYPWGSGENRYERSGDFLSRVEELEKSGMTKKDIARNVFKMSTTDLRIQESLAKEERKMKLVSTAKSLSKDGLTPTEIGRQMGGINESTIRSYLNEKIEAKRSVAKDTADFLEKQVKEKKFIDVGKGVEQDLHISSTKLNEAVYLLTMNGYGKIGVGVPTGGGKRTIVTVLHDTDVNPRDAYRNPNLIQTVSDYSSPDGTGKTFKTVQYPSSISSDRVAIRYGDQGGKDRDGVIEVKRNVPDLNLGNSHYAQVRIMVDGTHYLKGMAIYSDDKFPKGADIIFNTNKLTGTPKTDVLKKIKDDKDNPFGATIKSNGQSEYVGSDGKKHLSAINKIKEEGDWNDQGDRLPSQFLAKQPKNLIDHQLNLTYADKVAQYDEITRLTNPTVKKHLLNEFADSCDEASCKLSAAALPRQKWKVILPVDTLSDTEVYAPTYNNGEKVALVRYPHAGVFEIPELKVNNNHPQAKALLGNAIDAIGINSKTAEKLSGADFDGDTVIVIPTGGKVKVKTASTLEGLKDFDPKVEYADPDGSKPHLPKSRVQNEMGRASNLITDMNVKGATEDEIAAAVRHSMVIIDAYKHKLDYKQSYIDNNIAYLRKKYQGHIRSDGKYGEGASTLLSRANAEVDVIKRKGSPSREEMAKTGKKVYKESIEEFVDNKTGKTRIRTQKSKQMLEVDDANDLVSEVRASQELAYAAYANQMKSLAQQSRKEMMSTGKIAYSPEAKQKYSTEVDELNSALNESIRNAPKERRAQIIANAKVKAMQEDNPDMEKEEIKKAKQRAIEDARAQVGAKGVTIDITDKQWEAIQAGAISESRLSQILIKSNPERVKQLATPRDSKVVTPAQQNKIKAMSNSYTIKEIADSLNLSPSAVSKYINS